MREQIDNDTAGAIVFDADACGQIGADWFDPQLWDRRNALRTMGGGRGGVAVIDTPAGECVLRHYRRGGMVAGVLGDRYLWTGAERSRGFMEFRLLARLAALGLPVPAPVAARFVRHGLFYAAGLITRRVPNAQTLAQRLAAGTLDSALLHAVGATIARFHRAGAWHADLNAHNILLNAEGVHLIDFDRGRIRPIADAWRDANLHRLRRSLLKVGAGAQGEAAFAAALWRPLLDGYAEGWRA
jgi:3-deoxy-D-manno-octulosonic acid kinase